MTANEKELIEIVRNSPDPPKTMAMIIELILEYLASQKDSSEDEEC